MNRKIRVAITHGDINGISYEVMLKVLEDVRIAEICTPVLYGSGKIASFYRRELELPPVNFTQISSAGEIKDGVCNLINVIGEEVHPEPGKPSAEAGKSALAALDRAVEDLKQGLVDVLVTAPINKYDIQSEVFTFPGHTEYLQEKLGAGDDDRALMMLCADNMRVALVTTHLPVTRVAAAIDKDLIVEKIRILARSLHADFGITNPRIAVLALNPHGGENGLIGVEEQQIISPAIEEAREKKILAFGPYAADGFFGSGNFLKFDGILAMYHDQGLAPFKALAMGNGVNFTAGLPYVRTSPDHGTGYDIAGKGIADEASLRNAIYLALDIYRNRRREAEAHRHPLRRQYHEKGSDNVVLDLKAED